MQHSSTIIEVQGLSISFGKASPTVVVKDLTFDIGTGETLAMVGESGSGKSITSLSLMGLLPAGATVIGQSMLHVQNEDQSLIHRKEGDWQNMRGATVSMVFQEPMSALNPIMTVGKQLAECILLEDGISRKVAKENAIDWMRKVQLPEPEKLYSRFPHQLSGGQKQRIMIAMALCRHPALLIADEPTTALDATVQMEVLELIRGLQRELGLALLFITHDLALAAKMADKIVVLYQGEVMEYGNAVQVLEQPQNPYTKALLACRPDPDSKGKRLPIVADFMQGSAPVQQLNGTLETDISPLDTSKNLQDKPVQLQVQDLHVWFPSSSGSRKDKERWFKAVNGVSFEIHKGEILGLVGESGCGKSTISKALMGIVPIHSGQMLMNSDVFGDASSEAKWPGIRKQMQLIFQDPFSSLNPRMSIGDMLSEPLVVHKIVNRKDLFAEKKRLLESVQMPMTALNKYPHQFSGGQRQRIGIARALAVRPKILICDESVSALDVSVQAQILNLLKDLQQERQLSYLFISHDLNVVHYIADRVMVMKEGIIVEQGLAEAVLKSPGHAYTQRLVSAMAY